VSNYFTLLIFGEGKLRIALIELRADALLTAHELHPNFTNWHPPTNNRASHGKLKENYYKNFNAKFVLI